MLLPGETPSISILPLEAVSWLLVLANLWYPELPLPFRSVFDQAWAYYLWLWARLLTLDARLLPRGVFGIPSHSSASYSSPRKLLCCLVTVVKFIVLPSGGTFINANCCWAFLIDSIQDCKKLDVYIYTWIWKKKSISFTDEEYVYLGQFRFSGAENQSSWCRPIFVQINQA